jgi:hypothetical protein
MDWNAAVAQVGAAGNAAEVLLDRLAPAPAHLAADHPLQRGRGLGAVAQRVRVHRHLDGFHLQRRIDGGADPHVVDGRARRHAAVALEDLVDGLAVMEFAFDVPEAVGAREAAVAHVAQVLRGAVGNVCQGHRGFFGSRAAWLPQPRP